MTAVEMKYRFDIKMRELLKALNHPFNTFEINRLLNEAQLKMVQDYANYFDRNEEVRKILSVLVKPVIQTTSDFTTDSTNHPNGLYVTLPMDVLQVVSESVNKTIRVKPMSHDEYIVNLTNPFKQPDSTVVWRIDRDDKEELITDGSFTITEYRCDYIIMPPEIDIDNGVNCVLQDQVHEDIVNNAIKLALDIMNRTLQINKPKSN